MHQVAHFVRRLTVLALALAVASGLAIAIAEGRARTPEPTASEAALVERAACAAPADPAVPADGPALSVGVPPTALVQVGWEGEVLAALTNTGCAPRPSDDIFYVLPDGTVEEAPRAGLARRRWIGDFTTRGVYVAQQPST